MHYYQPLQSTQFLAIIYEDIKNNLTLLYAANTSLLLIPSPFFPAFPALPYFYPCGFSTKKESPIKNYRTSSLTNQNFKLWKLLFEVYNELPPSLHCKGTNKTVLVKCIFKFNKSLIQKGAHTAPFSVILILKILCFLRFYLPFLFRITRLYPLSGIDKCL